LAIGSVIFGLRPLVFQTVSMSPAIETGALAISQRVDASSLKKGQIVSVSTGTGSRVTHRIVKVTHQGDAAILRLRGDDNEAIDVNPYRVTRADRVLFDVPRLGYAVAWLAGPAGLFLLGLYAAFLLAVLFKRSPEPPRPTPSSAGGPSQRSVVTTGLAVLLLAGVGGGAAASHRVTPTEAAWTNDAKVDGTSLTAYTVPAPSALPCVVAPGNTASRGVRLDWPANAALGYTTSVMPTFATSTISDFQGNKRATVTYNPATAPTNQIVTVTARAHPVGSPTWLSPPTSWKFRTGVPQNPQPTCGEVVPPTVGDSAPDATTRTAAGQQTFLSSAAGCLTNGVILCGTTADSSTIENVRYILQRVQSGGTTCWVGGRTGWDSPPCAFREAAMLNPTTYYELGNTATVYGTPGGAYTLTVQVTDEWLNVATKTTNFTVTP
jgi:signal peptidase I